MTAIKQAVNIGLVKDEIAKLLEDKLPLFAAIPSAGMGLAGSED